MDIRVALKPFDEMAIEPRMSARDDKQKAHGYVIVLYGSSGLPKIRQFSETAAPTCATVVPNAASSDGPRTGD